MFELADLPAALRTCAVAIADQRDVLDAMNVFPVADADTGQNLLVTVEALAAAAASAAEGDLSPHLARAALSGRGNSGLIFGQYVAGFASSGTLTVAATQARLAVAAPVEGTMLSVADAVAAASGGNELVAATDAVNRTPVQLAVLAEAGVVDSGAVGLWIFLACLDGSDPRIPERWRPTGVPVRRSNASVAVAVGHEIMFDVPAASVDRSELERVLTELGTDVVVAAAAGQLTAHVHVADLDAASEELRGAIGVDLALRVEPLLDHRCTAPTGDIVGPGDVQ